MSQLCRVLIVVLGSLSAGAANIAHSEPLPAGVRVRLGTTRFRAQNSSDSFLLSPDGTTFALDDRIGVSLMDAHTGLVRRLLPDQRLFESPESFSPDGRRIVTKDEHYLRIWDTASGKPLWKTTHPTQHSVSAVFAAEGKVLVTWPLGEGVCVWDASTSQLLLELPLPTGTLHTVVVSRDGRLLAASLDSHTMTLWDLSTRKKIRTLPRQEENISGVDFFSDGRRLACWYREQDTIRLWDVETGKKSLLPGAARKCGWAQIARDGKTLVGIGDRTWPLYGWDIPTGKELWSLPGPGYWQPFLLSPDSRTFAILEDCTIVLRDLRTGKRIRSLEGRLLLRAFSECPFLFSADGRRLIARDGHAFRFWDTATGKELPRPVGHLTPPWLMSFSSDGSRMALLSGHHLHVWEPATGTSLQTHPRQGGMQDSHLALSGDGRLLVWANGIPGEPVRIWDVETMRECYSIPRRSQEMILALSGDSKLLAMEQVDWPGVILFEAATGKQRTVIKQPGRDVMNFAFSSDGKTLAVATRVPIVGEERPEVRLWDAATGSAADPRALPACGQILFSCDDRLLAIIDADRWRKEPDTVSVWERASGKKVATFELEDTPKPNWALTFTPSGNFLAGVIRDPDPYWLDNDLEVWDALANKKLRRLHVSGNHFKYVEFAPRARWLLTSMADTSILVWEPSVLSEEKPEVRAKLKAEEMERLWQQLADSDAEVAQKAVRVLTATPEVSVPFLEKRLRPVEATRFRRLLAALDAEEYSVREAASRELALSGPEVVAALRFALRSQPTLETRRRIDLLLKKVEELPLTPELLRQVRAAQVLEQIHSPEARQLLAKLAGGAAEHRLTQEARAALERLRSASPGEQTSPRKADR